MKVVYYICQFFGILFMFLNPIFLICLFLNGFDFVGLVNEMFYGGVK